MSLSFIWPSLLRQNLRYFCALVQLYIRNEWHLTNIMVNSILIFKQLVYFLLTLFIYFNISGRTTLLNFVLSIKKQTRPVPVNSDSLVERRNECTKKHFSSADQMI